MSAPKRKREVQVNFRVSPEELALIEKKCLNLGPIIGKPICGRWALDGYVVQLDFAGAERAGIPAAPEQQQSKPAHPPGA